MAEEETLEIDRRLCVALTYFAPSFPDECREAAQRMNTAVWTLYRSAALFMDMENGTWSVGGWPPYFDDFAAAKGHVDGLLKSKTPLEFTALLLIDRPGFTHERFTSQYVVSSSHGSVSYVGKSDLGMVVKTPGRDFLADTEENVKIVTDAAARVAEVEARIAALRHEIVEIKVDRNSRLARLNLVALGA